eukprot:4796884-Prorocentrum_lima.AAC.1
MTSSLVGSEMCIRDRVQMSMSPRQTHLGISGSLKLVLVSLPDAPQPQFCLLYTSDAADDM